MESEVYGALDTIANYFVTVSTIGIDITTAAVGEIAYRPADTV